MQRSIDRSMSLILSANNSGRSLNWSAQRVHLSLSLLLQNQRYASPTLKCKLTVGKQVGVGMTEPLFLVAADLQVVKVTVAVDRRFAEALRPGDSISFTADLAPSHLFPGKVTEISLASLSTDGTEKYDLVISAANPSALLRPGMSTTIRITLAGAAS